MKVKTRTRVLDRIRVKDYEKIMVNVKLRVRDRNGARDCEGKYENCTDVRVDSLTTPPLLRCALALFESL